jgi:cytoskeletal protein RodZ
MKILNSNEIILIGLILFSILIQIFLVIIVTNHFIKKHIDYLNNLCTIKISELKSDVGRLQRYTLMKNLKIMKKFIGWSILLVVMSIIVVGSVIIFDSREYFKNYFEKQRTELNLRSEASVDSLQIIITKQTKLNDSLLLISVGLKEKNQLLEVNLKKSEKNVAWLKSCLSF